MLSWGKSSTIFLMVLEVSFPFASFQWICLRFSSSDPLAYVVHIPFSLCSPWGSRLFFASLRLLTCAFNLLDKPYTGYSLSFGK